MHTGEGLEIKNRVEGDFSLRFRRSRDLVDLTPFGGGGLGKGIILATSSRRCKCLTASLIP